MRNVSRGRVIGPTLVAMALVAAACGDSGRDLSGPREGPAISVGSFDFDESVILAEIYALALEADGYTVERRLEAGGREVVNPALQSGELDFVPEYVGSALEVGFGQRPTADTEETANALAEAFEAFGVAVLEPAPAQKGNGIVVTSALAGEFGLEKVSDLAGQSEDLVFGGPPECPIQPRCFIGLTDVYALEFAEFKALDMAGRLTVEALDGGEIDVALLFTTDGAIAARGFVLLEDDQGLQPAENIVPLVRREILDAYGSDFEDLIDGVSAKITTEELTEMNRRFGQDAIDAAVIAGEWLEANGFL